MLAQLPGWDFVVLQDQSQALAECMIAIADARGEGRGEEEPRGVRGVHAPATAAARDARAVQHGAGTAATHTMPSAGTARRYDGAHE